MSDGRDASRRDFLRTSALGSAAALAGSALARAASDTPAAALDFPLEEATLAQLQDRLTKGETSARALVQAYLERIRDVDARLHAVVETNPEVFTIADALDAERKAKGARGPLHGIPVLIKDNIDTGDRMQTTAGSLALVGEPAPRDAFIVERLRAAGAIVLGKTNLSEWANFRSTHSSSGWSGRGGQTRNPYALDRSPSGSSSGSAVAAAANLCAVAIGTETDGSVVSPASIGGLVGVKPTVGLWSRSGIIPISESQDTAGPLARGVHDAAILLGALAGVDPRDPATAASAGHALTDYTQGLRPDALRGARIGVVRSLFGFLPSVDALAEQALAVLRTQGAELVDPVDITSFKELGEPEQEVLLYEFKAGLEAYLKGRGDSANVHTLAELIAYNDAHRAQAMPWFGQELLLQAQAKGPLTTPAYRDALAKCRRLARTEGIDAAMDKHRLDALVAPTDSPAWPIDLIDGDHYLGGCSTPAAVAGYPHVSVPAGFVHGLPVGVSFFGRAWSEARLLGLAYAYEQATRHRRAPRLLATAELVAPRV
jgi:amidase